MIMNKNLSKDSLFPMINHKKNLLRQINEMLVFHRFCLKIYVILLILKSYHNIKNCDQLNKNLLKRFSKLLSKRINRMINEFNNLQTENKRDREGERVHKDMFRKFPNRPCYRYVCSQFELDLR